VPEIASRWPHDKANGVGCGLHFGEVLLSDAGLPQRVHPKRDTSILILGLSPFRHHPSAALLQDGVIRAAIENHKLSRSSSREIPEAAIRCCLESAGVSWSDLDAITIATRPLHAWLHRSLLHARISIRAPLAGAYYEAKEIGSVARELNDLRILQQKVGIRHKTLYFDQFRPSSLPRRFRVFSVAL